MRKAIEDANAGVLPLQMSSEELQSASVAETATSKNGDSDNSNNGSSTKINNNYQNSIGRSNSLNSDGASEKMLAKV